MNKVLKVGGVTPSGVASGLRLTENGMLPIYSPQKDFFIGSVVEPVPHGHVGARGVFGLKCRAKTALHNAYNGGLTNPPLITEYGIVVYGMNRLQAFDGNLNPLWDISVAANRRGFTRSVNKGGVVVASGVGVGNLLISEYDKKGSLVASKNIGNANPESVRRMQLHEGHYFLATQVPGVSTTVFKLDASLEVVWQQDYPINYHVEDMLQFEGVLYLIGSHETPSKTSITVIGSNDGSILKEWYTPGSPFRSFFWEGYLYITTREDSLIRIELDADGGESFETVRSSLGANFRFESLAIDNNGYFFAVSGGADKRLYKINTEGEIELEIGYRDSLGSPIHQVTYHNGSIVACTWNELLVLSEDLQLKGYTLS